MKELPGYLSGGEDARLIPVVSESNKEHRLLSPVLATMSIVPEFAGEILGRLGIKVGKTTKVRALTEVVFVDDDFTHDRPDALVILTTGRREFRLLIEVKSRSNDLNTDQIIRYLELARAQQIDAVLSISNQFTANPTHSPVKVPTRLLKKVSLFHISWSLVATSVDLMLGSREVDDVDRTQILLELQRYLGHHSAGISGFTQMNKEWREVVKAISSGAKPRKSDEEILSTVGAWHQEQKDMCLLLSKHLHTNVSLKLPRKHRDSSAEWEKSTIAELLSSNCLTANIEVPDAAATISVAANLARKTATCSMRIRAPEHRKSAKARVQWLLRQIPGAVDPRFQVRQHFMGRKPHHTRDLNLLREKPEEADNGDGSIPNHLEIILHTELGGDFSGSKKFIEIIESSLFVFYDQAIVDIKQWQPSAPKPVKTAVEIESDLVHPGDLH